MAEPHFVHRHAKSCRAPLHIKEIGKITALFLQEIAQLETRIRELEADRAPVV